MCMGQRAHLQGLYLVRMALWPSGPSPGQHHQGLPRHAGKLEGKGAIVEHDDDAEDPLEDGRRVLEDEALLQEEHATWESEVKEGNRGPESIIFSLNQISTSGINQATHF